MTRVFIVFLSAVLFLGSDAAAACVSTKLSIVRPPLLGEAMDEHRLADKFIRDKLNAADANITTPPGLIASFDAALMKVARQRGANSIEWALMAIDRPFLAATNDQSDRSQYDHALEVLATRANRREVLDILFWHLVTGLYNSSGGPQKRFLEQILVAHRAMYGDRPEQRWLWARIAETGQYEHEAKTGVEFLTKYLAAMQAAGSVEGRIDAIARLLRHPSLKEADKIKRADLARHVFPDVRRQVDAAATAAKQTAGARDRTASSFSPDDCVQHEGEEIARAIIAGSSGQEALGALRVLARMVAIQGPPGTDSAGAVVRLGPVVAVRALESAAFKESAELYGRNSDCEVPAGRRSVCLPFDLARMLEQLQNYEIALRFAEDGIAIIDAKTDPYTFVEERFVFAAELHWKNGSAARARTLLDMIEQRPDSPDPFSSEFGIRRLVLEARVAEALLDDHRASELVRRILKEAAGQPPYSAYVPPGGRQPSPAETKLIQVADDLAREITLRRFCGSCENDVIMLSLDRERSAFSTYMKPNPYGVHRGREAAASFLALSRQAHSVVVPEERRRMARMINNLPPASFSFSKDATIFENFRRTLSKSDEISIATAISLMMTTGAGGTLGTATDGKSITNRFILFIIEKEINRKIFLWRQYFDAAAENEFEQLGAIDALMNAMDAYARHFLAAGYPTATRAILSDLIARNSTRPDGPDSQRLAQERDIARNAVLLVSVQARLAGLALDASDVASARRHLTEAQIIAVGRLRAEWREGDERSVGLIRQLRPALRLTAQTWLRIALDRTSAQPGDLDKALESLQLAMLGDTALATFAAERRKLLADPNFRAAREKLDQVHAELRLLEAVGSMTTDLIDTKALTQLTAERRGALALAERAPSLGGGARLIDEALAPISTELLRRTLRSGDGFLVLHAATDAVWGILLRPDSSPLVWRSPIALGDLERRVANVRAGLIISADGGLPLFPTSDAYDLATLVFGPALSEIGRLSALTMQVDGPLSVLPFNVLPLAKPEALPEDALGFRSAAIRWLGTTVASRVVPSAGTTVMRPRSGASTQVSFLGVGDPVLNGEPGGVRSIDFARVYAAGGLADPEALRKLRALPGTRAEVERASTLVGPSRVLLGPDASERTIRSMPLDGYRVILFATHGLTAGETGEASEPGLVLTPPSKASEEDDGLLTASEIQKLKLDADLVILSACNTGSSDGKPRAEGLTGLARAFLSAGARQLLVTGWSIPSEPTVALMTRMLGQPGDDRARALRDAMRWLAESHGGAENAHPAMWGAFMLIGGGDGRS